MQYTNTSIGNFFFFFHAPLFLALPRVDLQQGPDTLANAAPSLGSNGAARAVRQEVLMRRKKKDDKQTYNRGEGKKKKKW